MLCGSSTVSTCPRANTYVIGRRAAYRAVPHGAPPTEDVAARSRGASGVGRRRGPILSERFRFFFRGRIPGRGV